MKTKKGIIAVLFIIAMIILQGCSATAEEAGVQWKNKSWYAYGTSITNIDQEGKYAQYLADMSGLILTNKGISGAGIGNLGAYSVGQNYDAICNTSDGKLEADLITLEVGANDIAEGVDLGSVYDVGRSTLSGCLNDCIRYLQTYTDAQIVVFSSPAIATEEPSEENAMAYEWAEMVEKICHINRVHYVNVDCGMGWAKLVSTKGSSYIVDHGHHTDLGGYIYAQNIWYQLKNIPLFYTSMPGK